MTGDDVEDGLVVVEAWEAFRLTDVDSGDVVGDIFGDY